MMNPNNLEYLQKRLDYIGFGTKLNAALEAALIKNEPYFSIGVSQRYIPAEFRSQAEQAFDHMHFELKFNRSKNGDVYYLNLMESSLLRAKETNPRVKSFVMDQQNRISALQAYKLLCGLSFQKPTMVLATDDVEGKQYQKLDLWYKLDFHALDKQGEPSMKWFFPEHGFDLEREVAKFPFSELDDLAKRESIIKALRYGNLISLTIQDSGILKPVYVSANPERKTLDIYDQQMVLLPVGPILNPAPDAIVPTGTPTTATQKTIDPPSSTGLKR